MIEKTYVSSFAGEIFTKPVQGSQGSVIALVEETAEKEEDIDIRKTH